SGVAMARMERRRRTVLLALLAMLVAHAASAAPAPDRSKCNRAAFRTVVDVGHTAEVGGVLSARGVPEYVFNLRLAQQIDQKLRDEGFARTVLLITTEPPRRGLFVRAERANAAHADLFLSIHHDGVPDAFLETWEYEGQERAYSDRFRGHSI